MIQTFWVYFFSTEINLLICHGHKIATLAITIHPFVVGETDRKIPQTDNLWKKIRHFLLFSMHFASFYFF